MRRTGQRVCVVTAERLRAAPQAVLTPRPCRRRPRRSRERKAGRITGLQSEVERLRASNFVLLKCVEEVAHKALAARGEQRRLRVSRAPAPGVRSGRERARRGQC